ncbi:MAG: hypothetical protein U0835_05680 [Isosphaeraceae bacterium]
MRISFDLDDTIVCGEEVPADAELPFWRRWRYPERPRRGTGTLLRQLDVAGHEIWVYTTSFRSEGYLRGWFRTLGIRLGGVVNQRVHDRVVGRGGPSKNPRVFGIDLHVDDSDGVRAEGERHGFRVVVVSPTDPEWSARVLEAVDESELLSATMPSRVIRAGDGSSTGPDSPLKSRP